MPFDLASAKPVTGFDLSTAKPVGAPTQAEGTSPELREVALDEPNPHLVAAGASLGKIGEGVGQKREHAVGWLAEKIGNLLGSDLDRPDLAQKNKEAVAQRLKGVDEDVRANAKAREALGEQHPLTRITETGTDLGLGFAIPAIRGAEGAGFLRQASRAAAPVATGAAYSQTSPITGTGDFMTDALGQAGTGALIGGGIGTAFAAPRVVSKGVSKAKEIFKGAPAEASASGTKSPVYQRMSEDFENRMEPVREEAFRGPAVDVQPALDTISALKLEKSSSVAAALEKVEKELRRFADQGKEPTAQAITGRQARDIPSGGSMTMEQYKAMQAAGETSGSSISVKNLDEVRQEIKRIMDKMGAEKSLDSHTKELLVNLRNQITGLAPKEYQSYLQQYAKGAKDMEKYEVMDKLFPTNLSGNVRVSQGAEKWNQMRDDIKERGVFSPEHYAAIDKVMTDLFKKGESAAGIQTAAGMIGYLGGWKTSSAARAVAGKATKGDITPAQIDGMIEKVMLDEGAARLAAAPATPENMALAERLVKAATIEESRRQTQPKPQRRPNPLGMQPAGL